MTHFWKVDGKWRIGRIVLLAILLVLISCFLYTYHQKILRQLYLENRLEQQYGLKKDEYQIFGQFTKFGYGYSVFLKDEPRTSYLFSVRDKDGNYFAVYSGHNFLDPSEEFIDFREPKHPEFEQFRDDP